MKERKKFLTGKRISIVGQEALLDAKPFLKSRSDTATLELIGEKANGLNLQKVFDEMRHREAIGNTFPNMVWSIVTKKDEHYVGDISFFPLEDSYGIKVVILSKERNKGYGTEAINLLSNYFLMHPDIKNIYVQVYSNNPNAFALFKRLGFHFCHTIDSDHRLFNGSKCFASLLCKHL